jgi:5-methylcytosine-specific restriction endonuclease McrA
MAARIKRRRNKQLTFNDIRIEILTVFFGTVGYPLLLLHDVVAYAWIAGDWCYRLFMRLNGTPIVLRIDIRQSPGWTNRWYDLRSWFIRLCETELGRTLHCFKCNREFPPGQRKGMHVDHIDPVAHAPHKSLDPDNIQILCDDCNIWKSARRGQPDYRPAEIKLAVAERQHEILEKIAA